MLRLTAPEGRAAPCVARAENTALAAPPNYARHVPERTLLHTLVRTHYPDFIARFAAKDRSLPEYRIGEFEAYLRCGVRDNGFLRVVSEQCHAEQWVAFSCKQRGSARGAARGAWPKVRGICWRMCSARGCYGSGC